MQKKTTQSTRKMLKCIDINNSFEDEMISICDVNFIPLVKLCCVMSNASWGKENDNK